MLSQALLWKLCPLLYMPEDCHDEMICRQLSRMRLQVIQADRLCCEEARSVLFK